GSEQTRLITNPSLRRRSQYTPHPAGTRFLIRDRFAAEKAHLPSHDVVFGIWRTRPIDLGLDVRKRMAEWKRRIALCRIDQALEFFHRRPTPPFLSAHVLGRTAFVGTTPHVMLPIGFLLPNQPRLIVFDGRAVHHESEPSIALCRKARDRPQECTGESGEPDLGLQTSPRTHRPPLKVPGLESARDDLAFQERRLLRFVEDQWKENGTGAKVS